SKGIEYEAKEVARIPEGLRFQVKLSSRKSKRSGGRVEPEIIAYVNTYDKGVRVD
ncbi:hypothetical protein A2U01_0104629, partial [Trifolium medium]|nr:hypothetical protein [Trifolium medium]